METPTIYESTNKNVSSLNVGDIIVCKKSYYDKMSNNCWLKENNKYTILEIDIQKNSFIIIDEMKERLNFDSMIHFDEYLIPLKNYRKFKLQKICENK